MGKNKVIAALNAKRKAKAAAKKKVTGKKISTLTKSSKKSSVKTRSKKKSIVTKVSAQVAVVSSVSAKHGKTKIDITGEANTCPPVDSFPKVDIEPFIPKMEVTVTVPKPLEDSTNGTDISASAEPENAAQKLDREAGIDLDGNDEEPIIF